jgi:hypothetical protein
MLTRTRMRRIWLGCPAAWALALVVMAPSAAQAQHTGLFPLAPIKRERVPCPMEDPLYRTYRHEYYGYHPTSWRRFPNGWGVASPEAPDEKKAFGERKRDPFPDFNRPEGEGPVGPDDNMPPRQPGGDRGMPPQLPQGRSPFDLENPKPPADPAGVPPANDPGTPPAPAPAPRAEASEPGTLLTPPSTGNGNNAAPPALAVPDPTAANAPNPGPGWAGGPIPANPGTTTDSNPAGFQPAKRKSFLTELFNGNVFRR